MQLPISEPELLPLFRQSDEQDSQLFESSSKRRSSYPPHAAACLAQLTPEPECVQMLEKLPEPRTADQPTELKAGLTGAFPSAAT